MFRFGMLSTMLLTVFTVCLSSGCMGCTQTHVGSAQAELPLVAQENVPIRIGGHIESSTALRVIQSQWEKGDKVGVYLLKSSPTPATSDIVEGFSNIELVREQDGFFYPTDHSILFYPKTPKSLDILGYYPYKSVGADLLYPLDLRENPDFLYANNIKGFDPQGSTPAHMTFVRPLAQVQLSFEVASPEAPLTVKVKGVRITGAFNLLQGVLVANENSRGDLAVTVTNNGTNAQQKTVATRLFPGEQNVTFEIEYKGKTYEHTVKQILEAGKNYSYTLAFKGEEVVTTPTSPYLEIPRYGALPANQQVILHTVPASWLNSPQNGVAEPRNFTILYDTQLHMPIWVAYPVHNTYSGSTKRTNAWEFDPSLARNLQPDLASSWKGTTERYDRGHMMPSGDRTASRELNKTTFYFTNMAAQASKFNQGSWQNLESKVRSLMQRASDKDTIYVVVGCIPYPKEEQGKHMAMDNANKQCAIPQYMYKLLLRKDDKTGEYKSIAFNFPNTQNAPQYTSGEVYCSVEEIERLTGLTFFPAVPQSVKQQKNLSDWQ